MGVPGTTFTFRVKYSDADDDYAAWVRLKLWNGATQVPGSPFIMINESGSAAWQTGVIFTLTMPLANRGLYRYSFQTSDRRWLNSLPAGGVRRLGPKVDTSPTLSWAGTPGYTAAGVAPTTGPAGSFFIFMVKYSDPEGDVPSIVKVRVYRLGSGEIAGSPFAMSLAAGSDYSAGVIYSRMLALNEVGDYKYRFAACDGLLTTQFPGTTKAGPTVTP